MPTVFTQDGFRFFFYSADWQEPMHVHIEYGEAEAKFWLQPIELASSYRMKAKDIKKARILLEQHHHLIVEQWHEYFRNRI